MRKDRIMMSTDEFVDRSTHDWEKVSYGKKHRKVLA